MFWTHPKQHPGVEPSVHQEGHVEMDKQEGVDSQPNQLKDAPKTQESKENRHI